MFNWIWVAMIGLGVWWAGVSGQPQQVTASALRSSQAAVQVAFDLLGSMVLWMGLGKVAERSGLIAQLGRAFRPLLGRLFPELPPGHPAAGAITMNLSANLLGMGSAATPFGLKAMQELQKLNPSTDTATPAMCTFLALNTSSVTLIPATVIALRAANGSSHPEATVAATLLATVISSAVALAVDALFRRRGRSQPT